MHEGILTKTIFFDVSEILRTLCKKLNVELEAAIGGTPGNGVAVVKMPFTTSGAWEELTFDFSGISGIPAGTKFAQLVLRFNDSQDGTQEVFYVDNFKITN